MSNKTSVQRRELQKPTRHHRKPLEIGGARHKQRNISLVPLNQHQAWHLLFGIMQAPDICKKINDLFLDPDYQFVCIKTPEDR